MEKLIIIGSGPAGLTASIYAARSKLDPLIIEGREFGGQLMGTTYVENWPGEKQILGPQLMMNMKDHAAALGVRFTRGNATAAHLDQYPFSITVEDKEIFKAEALIIATGAESKKLAVPGEKEYWGKGVTTCAICDGMFYKDQPVIIVGGGDTAMENASLMLNYTDDITIVQIKPELTAAPLLQSRVKGKKGVKILYNSTISRIEGNGKSITSVTVENKKSGKTERLPAKAVFVSIGYHPNTELFKPYLAMDSEGYLEVTHHTTSKEGVFAAGDVSDYRYRQAITAAGSGCMAALDAERYLKTRS